MLKSQIKIVKNGYLCSIFALRFPELPRSILQCSGTGQPQQPVAGDRICKLLSVTGVLQSGRVLLLEMGQRSFQFPSIILDTKVGTRR